MSPLRKLADWYVSQCDGRWEHHSGLKIHTIDNPGFLISIDLFGTFLEQKQFDMVSVDNDNGSWLHCNREGPRFTAACSPDKIEETIEIFLNWAQEKTINL